MRILLKLSGEALAGDKKTGFDEETVRKVALRLNSLSIQVHRLVLLLAAEISGEDVPVRISTELRQTRSECLQLS